MGENLGLVRLGSKCLFYYSVFTILGWQTNAQFYGERTYTYPPQSQNNPYSYSGNSYSGNGNNYGQQSQYGQQNGQQSQYGPYNNDQYNKPAYGGYDTRTYSGYGYGPQYDPRSGYYWSGHSSGGSGSSGSSYVSDGRPSVFPQTDILGTVRIRTKLGEVVGATVPLYDGPGLPYWQRPGMQQAPRVYKNVTVFLGIPYAKAPIFERRFKPPEPHPGWQVIEASQFRPACPQPQSYTDTNKGIGITNEDCLFLNIYTPGVNVGVLHPVIVYIHGGEFEHGSGNIFPGHMLAASQEVVVVTFNYRLGPLGFFSTADGNSPGNYGMLDQALAIHWVHDHIEVFRGDPKKITLYGVGAGAASAGLHMISPRTRGIFQQVIAQSGSALADWAAISVMERATNNSRVFGEMMGCPIETPFRLVDCLRTRSAADLCNQNIKPQAGMFPWAPVVDKNISIPGEQRFLPDDPITMFTSSPELLESTLLRKAYLTGVTRDEAAYLLMNDYALSLSNYEVDVQAFNQRIHEYIKMYNYTLNPDGVFNAIAFMYTYWPDALNKTAIRDMYIQMLSDAFYIAPNDEMMKLMTKVGVKTYAYVLNSTVEAFRRPYWQAMSHDTEYFFVTGAPFMDPKFYPNDYKLATIYWTEQDRNVSEFMMRTFANFAKFGNPTPAPVLDIMWPPVYQKNLVYLNLNGTLNSTIERDYRQRESSFWNSYLPLIIGPPPPRYDYFWDPFLDVREPVQVAFWGAIAGIIILLIVLLITCGLYCRALGKKYDPDDYEGSLVPDDVSLTHPTSGGDVSGKSKKFDLQHTSV